MGQDALSLNYSPNGDDGQQLLEILSDPTQELPDQVLSGESRKQDIEDALATLDDRERSVVQLYFGLEDGSEMTLAEIGSIFDLSRERIRQIKDRALSKLRHSSRQQGLESLMTED